MWKQELPEHLVTKIFKIWDEKGIDFSILKLLGIDKGFALFTNDVIEKIFTIHHHHQFQYLLHMIVMI